MPPADCVPTLCPGRCNTLRLILRDVHPLNHRVPEPGVASVETGRSAGNQACCPGWSTGPVSSPPSANTLLPTVLYYPSPGSSPQCNRRLRWKAPPSPEPVPGDKVAPGYLQVSSTVSAPGGPPRKPPAGRDPDRPQHRGVLPDPTSHHPLVLRSEPQKRKAVDHGDTPAEYRVSPVRDPEYCP
jgi:hypothetical protein